MPRPFSRSQEPVAEVHKEPLRHNPLIQKNLLQLKIATPITVLVNIIVGIIAVLVINPSLAELNNQYYTLLTPSNLLVGIFWLVLFVLQLGYCLIVLTAYKDDTLETLTSPFVGPIIPILNIALSFWGLFFCLRYFIVSEAILLFMLLLSLILYLGGLLRHPASLSRPFDYLFIHAPYRLLLVFLLNLDVLHNGLLALGWYHDPNGQTHQPKPPRNGLDVAVGAAGWLMDTPQGWEEGYEQHSWIVFTVLLGLGFLSDAVIFITTDPVWTVGTIYAYLCIILKHDGGKPPQIFIPCIFLSVTALVSFLASLLWDRIAAAKSKEGQIRLAEEDDYVDGTAYSTGGGLHRTSQDIESSGSASRTPVPGVGAGQVGTLGAGGAAETANDEVGVHHTGATSKPVVAQEVDHL